MFGAALIVFMMTKKLRVKGVGKSVEVGEKRQFGDSPEGGIVGVSRL